MTRYIGVATDDMSAESLRSQLADNSLSSSGAARVGYDGETVESALDKAKAFPSYAELRAYRGLAEVIHITNPGIEGDFSEVGSVSPIDNGGTLIVDALGRSWKRTFEGSVDVRWFGAGVGGNDTAAFSAAAKAAPAANNITGARGSGGIPRAPMCQVVVPDGQYTLTALLDVANKDVTWVVAPAALVTGYNFINGNVFRAGQRYTGQAIGSVDYACGQSVRMNNAEMDAVAEITGVPTQAGFGAYGDRDVVGFYADCTSRPALVSAPTAAYTATSAAIGAQSADTIKRLRVGMFIDTLHAPNRWTGILKSWNADASVLTVEGWYLVNDAVNPPSTPPSTLGLKVNAYTKIWAHNANIYLEADGEALGGTGIEVGVYNRRGDASEDITQKNNRTWIFDAVGLGDSGYRNQVGHVTRGGKWIYGCASQADILYPFAHFDEMNFLRWRVDSTGSMELGKNGGGVPTPSYMDWHTSGNQKDYDVRMIVSGGAADAGDGVMQIAASTFITSTHLPSANALFNIGSPSALWATGYFSTVSAGALNASVANVDNIELGANTVTSAVTRVIDAHSSGINTDYDVRIEFTGGTATAGNGGMTVRGASMDLALVARPSADLGQPLGQPARRFSQLYAKRVYFGDGIRWLDSGTGTPEGNQIGPVGCQWMRTDGGAGTTFYVKESGTGNTGWVAK